jgi:hypothetical protein
LQKNGSDVAVPAVCLVEVNEKLPLVTDFQRNAEKPFSRQLQKDRVKNTGAGVRQLQRILENKPRQYRTEL